MINQYDLKQKLHRLKEKGHITHEEYMELKKAIERKTVLHIKPKPGYWIEQEGYDGDVYYDCSECGESWTTIDGTPIENNMHYCPHCGAKMVEPQESEEV